jgi:hypothetical protein
MGEEMFKFLGRDEGFKFSQEWVGVDERKNDYVKTVVNRSLYLKYAWTGALL